MSNNEIEFYRLAIEFIKRNSIVVGGADNDKKE